MKHVDALLRHPDFLAAMRTIEANEATRRFCRHGLAHHLDVARITWILALEHARDFDKETIYLAALLHDLGRSVSDADHDHESVRLARQLLPDCGVNDDTIERICTAIAGHRNKRTAIVPATADLGALLTLADKRSRACFQCPAAADCHWPEALKNTTITY